MRTANLVPFKKLSHKQAKFIKSLRLKKNRQKENAFVIEGTKNVQSLLDARYTVQMIVGTPNFINKNKHLGQTGATILQVDEDTLASLGTFATNKSVLAIAQIPPTHIPLTPSNDTWGLVLDNIRDPGNLGTILRTAAWYNIPALICSPNTVDLYNPKVLHASMGSFTHVQVHYTSLPDFLKNTPWPILGTSTEGNSIYNTPLPLPSLMVIGNESRGISPTLLPYIQQRISIPRHGQAESLNAAMATAIVCDHWQRQQL